MHPGEETLSLSTQFSLMGASTVFALMGTLVRNALTDSVSLKILRPDHLSLGNRVAEANDRTGRHTHDESFHKLMRENAMQTRSRYPLVVLR